MATRSAESLLHEADYWRLVLQDLLAVNDLTVEASEPLVKIPMHVLTLFVGADALDVGQAINASSAASLDALVRMHDPITRMVDLVKGRETAMRRELEEVADER